jgi:hypothetical protein
MLASFYSWLQAEFGSLATICPVSGAEGASYPIVTYQLVGDRPTHTLDGSVPTVTSDIRLEIMSLDHADADAIANEVSGALDGFRGVMSSGTGSGLSLSALTLEQLSMLTLDALSTLPVNAAGSDSIFVIVKRLDGGDGATVYDPSCDQWVYIRHQDYQIRWVEI